ncbi:MAG: DUF5119 domain-containing protein [Bacteroidaceae bacterium]|nr:DUF5119 domain-containing protein [Bacteroidaceae bacterium]
MKRYGIHRIVKAARSSSFGRLFAVWAVLVAFTGCIREPELHLPGGADAELSFPFVALQLDAYWDYELAYGIQYDWRSEWYYGWDEKDLEIFGEIGYVEPTVFNLRRYYTGSEPYAPHTSVLSNTVKGNTFQGRYNWGFWDILVWNDVYTLDGVQSLNFEESTSLESVTAYTNQTMVSSRYNAPKYTRAFYPPEPLFSAYEQAIEIRQDLEGFEFDAERNVYVKKLGMVLRPITYIYLTQVILYHNGGRVVGVEGTANLSGMARSVVLNTGVSGEDAITVNYNTRLKSGCNVKDGQADIIGGRLLTFGICNQNGNKIQKAEDVIDNVPHYIDLTMQFNNGMDSTFVFDVSRQIRSRWKGGVITIELDMDTIPTPHRKGGSAFDAVVKDFEDGGTREFEM